MSRPSTIDLLPEEIRLRLLELLKTPGVSQAQVTEIINVEAGGTVVSKSAVNRYAQRMDNMIEKTRQAREVADLYLSRVGDDTRNQLGKVINERVRMLAFDLTDDLMAFRDGEDEQDSKAIAEIIQKVSRAIKELEQAEKLNAERETKIRKATLEEAAAAAEEKAVAEGLSKDGALQIKKGLLGLI